MAISTLGTDVDVTNVATSSGGDNHTLASGSNRVVWIAYGLEHDESVTTITATYGGVSMVAAGTFADADPGNPTVIAGLFYLLEADLPADGSNAFQVTWAGSAANSGTELSMRCGAIQGAAQSAPSYNAATGSTVTTITNTISMAVGEWSFSACCGSSAFAQTQNESQTELLEYLGGASTAVASLQGAGSTQTQQSTTFATPPTGLAARAVMVFSPLVELTSSTPTDNATGIAVDANIVLTFSDSVTAGTGNFYVKEVSDDSTAATIAVGSVGIVSNVVTITLPSSLTHSTEYYLEAASGVITDWAGVAKPDLSWTTKAVQVSSLSPSDNATDIAVDTTLALTLDENVSAGTGDLDIYDGGGLVESIAIGSAAIVDNVVTFTPVSDLDYSTAYYVQIDSGAIVGYPGIADTTTWNFTTADPPPIAFASSTPFAGAQSVAVDTTIVIAIDANIQAGTGNVYLRDLATGTAVATYDIGDPEIGIAGPNLTITPASDLDATKSYYVTWDAGAFESTLGAPIAANTSDSLVWFSCKTPTTNIAFGGVVRGIWIG